MNRDDLKALIESGKYDPINYSNLEKVLLENPDLMDDELKEQLKERPNYKDRFGTLATALARDAFKRDLGEYLELSSHPKYNLLFDMAWENGHTYGHDEVVREADGLARLLKPDEPAPADVAAEDEG